MPDPAGSPSLPPSAGTQPPPGLLGITSRVTEADTAAVLTAADIEAAIEAMRTWQPPPDDEAVLTADLIGEAGVWVEEPNVT